MTKNPFINALFATAYITIVASVMFYGMHFIRPAKSIIIPMAMLSLFTLSAALMCYLFGSQPLQLYLDGKKREGVKLFLQTVGIFAVITLLLFVALFSRIF